MEKSCSLLGKKQRVYPYFGDVSDGGSTDAHIFDQNSSSSPEVAVCVFFLCFVQKTFIIMLIFLLYLSIFFLFSCGV
jgi:hypothetical protein